MHVLVDAMAWFSGQPLGGGAPVACPAPPPTVATFGDGTWRVGIDIPPGRYTLPAASNCYWERTSAFANASSEINANDSGAVNPVVGLEPTDVGFVSSRCGPWTRIGD